MIKDVRTLKVIVATGSLRGTLRLRARKLGEFEGTLVAHEVAQARSSANGIESPFLLTVGELDEPHDGDVGDMSQLGDTVRVEDFDGDWRVVGCGFVRAGEEPVVWRERCYPARSYWTRDAESEDVPLGGTHKLYMTMGWAEGKFGDDEFEVLQVLHGLQARVHFRDRRYTLHLRPLVMQLLQEVVDDEAREDGP